MSEPAVVAPQMPLTPRDRMVSLTLLTVLAAALAGIVSPGPAASLIGAAALLLFLPFGWPLLGVKETGLVIVAIVVSLGMALTTPGAGSVLLSAISNGINLAALMLSLAFLRNAAASAPLIRECGRYLAGQPPGRRYLALSSGGHLFGLILNFGVLNLLGPIVQQSGKVAADATAEEKRRAGVRRQRMVIALLRGFALVTIWSPTTVAQAVIITSVAGLTWINLVPFTLSLACLIWALGWLHDRLAWRQARRGDATSGNAPSGNAQSGTTPTLVASAAPPPSSATGASEGGWKSLVKLSGLVASILGCVVALNGVAGLSLVQSVTVVAPIFAAGWHFQQTRTSGQSRPAGAGNRIATTVSRLRVTVDVDFPKQPREVALLGSAGFIGGALPAVIPADALIGIASPLWMTQPTIGIVMMLALVIGGLIGLNPLIAVPVIGGLLAATPEISVNPVFAGLALAAGWGLCNGSSPFTASAMVAGRIVGLGPETIVWRWNGPFTILAVAVCSVCLVAVSPLLPAG